MHTDRLRSCFVVREGVHKVSCINRQPFISVCVATLPANHSKLQKKQKALQKRTADFWGFLSESCFFLNNCALQDNRTMLLAVNMVLLRK